MTFIEEEFEMCEEQSLDELEEYLASDAEIDPEIREQLLRTLFEALE